MSMTFDVIVVGSGPTGGYAAKALCASGLRVLVLEAGPGRIARAAVGARDRLRRRLGYHIEEDPAAVRRQPTQSAFYAWPVDPHAFVDDLDNPYSVDAEKPFSWIRSRQVGGRMRVRRHGLQFYRMSDLEFRAGTLDGASPSWPIGYADVAPYYERVERWLRLRGSAEGIAHLPDAALAATVDVNAGERLLGAAIGRIPAARLIPGRTANAPFPIAEALATGRCTLRCNAVTTQLLAGSRTAALTGVRYLDTRTRRTREVSARVVVLCASAIESARLMLASATAQHPNGIGNSSDMVGRCLMDHTHVTGVRATMPLLDPVRSPSWAYIPRFHNLTTTTERFVRGFGIQVFTMWRECALSAFGEMLPDPKNRILLSRTRTDTWGVPAVHIECAHGPNERAMLPRLAEDCIAFLDAAGFSDVSTDALVSRPGMAAHEVGTARMGSDPRTSVLNSFCQSWDIPNLFVMDGSCFVTSGVQNPTLTMLALAARSTDYLIESLRRGDI